MTEKLGLQVFPHPLLRKKRQANGKAIAIDVHVYEDLDIDVYYPNVNVAIVTLKEFRCCS